jgi:hypothetical protein
MTKKPTKKLFYIAIYNKVYYLQNKAICIIDLM